MSGVTDYPDMLGGIGSEAEIRSDHPLHVYLSTIIIITQVGQPLFNTPTPTSYSAFWSCGTSLCARHSTVEGETVLIDNDS